MKKYSYTLILAFSLVCLPLMCLPLNAASRLPAGSALSYALTYYKQHVIAGKSCPITVAINARNKSAILKAAMPGYKAASSAAASPNQFGVYFSAVVQRSDRCHSALAGLPVALIEEVSKAAHISKPGARQASCPTLEAKQKQAFELYLEALTAKVVWDAVNKQC